MSTRKISITEIFLYLLVFLFVLVALAPYAIGFKVKSDYTQLVNDLAQGLQLDLEIDNYEQGFFTSESRLRFSIDGTAESIYINETIIHGPLYLGLLSQGRSPFVAAVINGELEADNTDDIATALFAGEKPLVYQNIVDFTGNVDSQAYVPAMSHTVMDESGPGQMQTSGMIINQTYIPAQKMLKGDASVPSFRMHSNELNLTANHMEFSFSGEIGSSSLMTGDSVVSIGLLDVDSGDSQFAMRDMTLQSVSSEAGDLLNSGAKLAIREILASNHKFGPLNMNISMNGLSAAALLRLQQTQEEINRQIQQGIPKEQANAMLMGQLMGVVPELIRQAQIQINPLRVNSELGKLEADLDFSLEGIDANTPPDPMFLMSAINLQMNMSVDEALLRQMISWQLKSRHQAMMDLNGEDATPALSDEQLAQQVDDNINALIQENWLVMNENVYLSELTMKQGALTINGKAVDPMQQMMSSMQGGQAVQ